MRELRAAALALAALVLLGCGTGAAATPVPLWVAPGGDDGSQCTERAPCGSIQRAYRLARPGQVVQLAAGTYAAQTIGDGGKSSGPDVVVRPAPGARVSFAGRLTLAGASFLTLEDLRLANVGPGDRSLFLEACTHDVTVRRVTGTTFLVLEGNANITFLGGSWGGYGTPGQEDSAIGTGGADGPTRSCNGTLAPPSRRIVFDGVTFHDVFWGVAEKDWGSSHPDCFEINGYVDGVVVRRSRFVRCASTFMQINPDQGDITNVTFTGNVFAQIGPDTWYGTQIVGNDGGGRCGNVVYSRNTYLPGSPGAATWPNAPLLTACPTVEGMKPVVVTRNLFERAPPENECARYRAELYGSLWSDNVFAAGACGEAARGVPFGYALGPAGLRPRLPAATAVRRAFALAAAGAAPAAIARRLPGRWTPSRVAALLRDPVYAGGAYGAPGSNPPLRGRR